MKKQTTLQGLFLCAVLFFIQSVIPSRLSAQEKDGGAGVTRAALDYIEGFYEGDTLKIIRGVSESVNKYGYYKNRQTGVYEGEPMSFREMIDYANRVKQKGRFPKPDAPKDVQVLDAQDQTAAVKITAWWGTDYLLLARENEQWKIKQVLWQGPLPAGK